MFNVIKIEMKVEQSRNNNTRRQNSRFHFEKLFFLRQKSHVANCTIKRVTLLFMTSQKRKEKRARKCMLDANQ